MNDDYRAIRATRADCHGVILTHIPILASALGVVDVAGEKEFVGWNVVTAVVRHFDSVCIERHGELGVTDRSLSETNGPRRR